MTDVEIKEIKEIKKMIADLRSRFDPLLPLAKKKGLAVYTNKELKELLGIGDKLLKKWRDEGYLGFSRMGDKYYYSEKDVVKFLKLKHWDAFQEC